MELTRFGVSIDDGLLSQFDRLITNKGYTNRSEAIRDLIRDSLVQTEWESATQETIGTITLVYNSHTHELSDLLTRLQHGHYQAIISTTHIHLDEENCLEVLIVRGRGQDIKKISDQMTSARGVKHGRLSLTTTGKDII